MKRLPQLVLYRLAQFLVVGDGAADVVVIEEVVVTGIRDQISEVGLKNAGLCLPFIGTLFLFIVTANLCTILPGYEAPTYIAWSLSNRSANRQSLCMKFHRIRCTTSKSSWHPSESLSTLIPCLKLPIQSLPELSSNNAL